MAVKSKSTKKTKKPLSRFIRSSFRNQIIFVLIFAVVGGYILLRVFASSVVVGTLYASTMTGSGKVLTTKYTSNGYALKLTTSVPATGSVTTNGTATNFSLRARGVQCNGAPIVIISINGTQVLTATVSNTTFSSFNTTLTPNLPASTYTVTATFSNPYKTSSCTRALILDKLVFTNVSTTSTTPTPIGISGNWTLKFDDEFNGTSLNQATWTPGWFGSGISGPVNSSELNCYDSSQVQEPGDGYLHLNLISQASSCKSSESYTGALVSSNPSDGVNGHSGYQYAYGVVEWRAYLPPSGTQIANWPATWSDGQSWPTDGENDTMEGLGGPACFHFHSPSGGPGNCVNGNYSGWHTFASNWQPGVVTYYYDGVQVGQITTGITSQPQYLIMNNSVESDSPIATPATMLVDYVRVWQ